MNNRNYGIDLLRLVLIFMVCMLHTLGHGSVLTAFDFGSKKYFFFYLPETICYCAVDGFALISGYTASEGRKLKGEKIIEMWFQAFFYSFVLTAIFYFTGVKDGWSGAEIKKAVFPVTNLTFWYFTSYFALFFAMPLLNRALFQLDKDKSLKVLIGMIILFCTFGFKKDPYITNVGYSFLWLAILYCIGLLMKRSELFEKVKTGWLLLILVCSWLIPWLYYVIRKDSSLISYISPFVLLSGMVLVALFSRLSPNKKVIGFLSPLAFGIYLFQMNPVVWDIIIKGRLSFITGVHPVLMCLIILGFACLIFVAGLIVDLVRSLLFRLLRISKVSLFISKICSKVFGFITGLVKKLFVG